MLLRFTSHLRHCQLPWWQAQLSLFSVFPFLIRTIMQDAPVLFLRCWWVVVWWFSVALETDWDVLVLSVWLRNSDRGNPWVRCLFILGRVQSFPFCLMVAVWWLRNSGFVDRLSTLRLWVRDFCRCCCLSGRGMYFGSIARRLFIFYWMLFVWRSWICLWLWVGCRSFRCGRFLGRGRSIFDLFCCIRLCRVTRFPFGVINIINKGEECFY